MSTKVEQKAELTPAEKITREEHKKKLKYMRDKDRQNVRGIFRFHEVPGGVARFCTKFYKEDPVEWYELIDGQVYEIPLGVAKHLNKNCWTPEYEYIKTEQGVLQGIRPGGHATLGNDMMRIGKKIHRMSFQSLEFVDIEDITPAGGVIQKVEMVHANNSAV